jgi:Ca2+-binding EF-hand superfamily protein
MLLRATCCGHTAACAAACRCLIRASSGVTLLIVPAIRFRFPRSDNMKIALHLLAVTLFCFVSVAIARAADDAAEKPKDAPAKPAEVAAKNFNAMDKDGDGALTCDEFKGTRKKPAAIEQGEKIFKLIDADGDGKVTLKEFINRSAEARFTQMDRDNDGKLTWDEFKGTRKPEEIGQAEESFKRMDTDEDKSLCLDEFKAGQKPPVKPAKKAAGKKFQSEPVKSAAKP